MSFFQLVRREMQGSLDRLVLVSGLGGISTASILAAINSGAQAADSGKVSLWSGALFITALFLFVKTQHYILITTTAEIEGIVHKLRVRLMDLVRRNL
jgi:putative ATP-binding cassette transporter